MSWTSILVIPILSSFIGWVTIWIAIKMLFHPASPKKIAGITIQGIFPKRQEEIASKLAKMVSSELFSFTEIEKKIADPENVAKLIPALEIHIDNFLREKLPIAIPMIGMLIGDRTIVQLKGVFIKELETMFPVLMKQYMIILQTNLDFEKIVDEKVRTFFSNSLEEILHKSFAKEFKFVQIFGAVIGFIIGLLQVFFIILAA